MRTASDIEQTMERYGDAVWRACLLYLRPCEAEDVFQDVFMKYALHDEPFREEEHVKAWLLRVAVNACKDVLKSARHGDVSLEDQIDQHGEASLGASSEAEGRVREVLDAMNALGDPPKTQLYLALYEGYTASEISAMLDMPEGTVYSWISRGKKKLREVLR